MGISSDIQRELKKRGWSQYRLAQDSGLETQDISRIIRNDTDPRISTVTKIAKAFNITVDELVSNPKPTAKIRGKPKTIKDCGEYLGELGLGPDDTEEIIAIVKLKLARAKGQGRAAS